MTAAGQSGTSPETSLLKTRQAALRLLTRGGPWVQVAAEDALSETEAGVKEFLTTGLALAVEQDDRASVSVIIRSTTKPPQRAAAVAAAAGSHDVVKEFLRTKFYPGKPNDDRQEVNRIMAAAGAGTVVHQAGSDALTAELNGDADALQRFLEHGRYTAAKQEDRKAANRALATGGPEVRAAAQAALSGPDSYVTSFLQTELPKAQLRDSDTATHVSQIASYLASADQSAAAARQSAHLAAEQAAIARNAADEAHQWNEKAQASAATAAEAAKQAKESADAAQRSADEAAASAKRARDAAAAAGKSAQRASASAAYASSQATYARTKAAEAKRSADDARTDAIEAGKDAEAAARAAEEARTAAAKFTQVGEQRENIGDVPDEKAISQFGVDRQPENLRDNPTTRGLEKCKPNGLNIGGGPPIYICDITIEHHITGTMRYFTYQCPPGATQREQCTRVEIGSNPIDFVYTEHTQLKSWEAVGDALVAIGKALIDDFVKCANDKGWNQAEGCAWIAASMIIPVRIARLGKVMAITPTRFLGDLPHKFEVRLSDGSEILTEINNGGQVSLLIEVKTESQGIGRALVQSAFDHYGAKITSILGKWVTSMPSNLNSFNANLLKKETFHDAAFNTFTGKMAREYGYTNVKLAKEPTGTPGYYTDVEVIFY
ncbi:ALF repeat-containing protein [Amycolatopsis sp. BJA-103]|uniref:ALF repeat-containing protein n=1 Tax=Amycolatopsis sp. BJA-103 TaxID=1911175 RepID=UPI0021009454|nr:ALF repeat-containing protein [Amycolatopsis sp. BJA-103]